MMSFFSPLIAVIFSTPLAAFAVAGGIASAPIIIHLLNRKRFIVVAWAAMRFLLAAQKKNIRRLRLEQWLLLAVRVLIGILIVAAMASIQPWAEPFWQRVVPHAVSANVHQGRTHRIIAIDGSFTMAAHREDDNTRFDLAKAQAKAVLDQSAPGDGYTLIFLASPAQVIVPGPADDRKKVIEEIDELKLPHGSADVPGGLRIIADMLNRPIDKYNRREVTFITDLKRSGWPLLAAVKPVEEIEAPVGPSTGIADSWQTIAKAADIVFIDVARQDVDNLAVTNIALGDSLPIAGTNTSVSATLQNFGTEVRKKVPVELRVGQAMKPGAKLEWRELGQKLVDVPPGNAVTVVFPLENQNRFHEAGEYVLQVKAGDDSLWLDDVRSLAVTVRQSISVLIVDGKLSAEPLDTPGEWVRRALRPGRADARNIESPVTPAIVSASQFADRFRTDLTKYDCVFLCDLPSVSGSEADRLEAHLRRGGSIIVSLGPNAAKNIDDYNRTLFNDGKGILPVKLLRVKTAEEKGYFSLSAEEDAFKSPPLSAFKIDRVRAALTNPRFHRYVQVDAPSSSPGRRIFSFVPAAIAEKSGAPHRDGSGLPDPAVLDIPRHRGRIILYMSTFNPEGIGNGRFWSAWPPHPTFLPFLHEIVKYAVAGGNRRNLLAGDSIEEYLPVALTGLKAKLIRVDSDAESILESADVISRDDAAVIRFSGIDRSGIYRVIVGANSDSIFAVNVPVTATGGGAESDLKRLTIADLQSAAPEADVQLVMDASEVQPRTGHSRGGDSNFVVEVREPRGTSAAKYFLLMALTLMFIEVYLAWQYGSARSSSNAVTARLRHRMPALIGWILPSIVGITVLATLAHAIITNDFLGFLPPALRQSMERSLGIPAAASGEGTRWRLEAMAYVTGSWQTDRWIVGMFAIFGIAYVMFIYLRERTGLAPLSRRRFFGDPKFGPAVLRIQLLLITLCVLLPQLRLAFKRESWPDIVIMFDDSRSMAVVEPFSDPLLREKIEELRTAWEELAKPRITKIEMLIVEIRAVLLTESSQTDAQKRRDELAGLEKKRLDLQTPHRLNLIKALLASASQDWLQTLVRTRQMRVHLYRVSSSATRMASLSDPAECAAMLEEIIDIIPDGDESRLGDALSTVLKTFRGGSLSAIVMFTDGQRTKGEEIPEAANLARQKGVPLYLVGVGDNQPKPDIIVSNLKAEREINVRDNLIFDFTLTSQGPGMPDSVPVNLFEIVDGKRVRRNLPRKYPTNSQVRLSVTPDSAGDKQYVIEVPVQSGESDPKNNTLEHEVHVAEMKRVRVLMIECTPRYEFRYIKALFERETEKVRGNKSIELNVFLTGANREYFKQDKSAIAEFPTWDVLKTYDAIILGDVDPKQFAHQHAQIKLIADFVKERGGGLLMIAGEHFSPTAYSGTDLADVLPIVTEGIAQQSMPKADDPPITAKYRPRLTTTGLNHPIFRFVADDSENATVWNQLKEMFWFAKGYRAKLSAEVLAVHPTQLAEAGRGTGKDELHPLVLQQFVGGGRVMFFGFDETWRWRYRLDEPRFNQFWTQAIRSLARQRVGRIEVRLEQRTFRRDDPIRVTVRFPDDAPAPPPNENIRINVERRPLRQGSAASADPNIETIQLNRKEGSRATYEALLTRTSEGEYRFVLSSPTVPGRPPPQAEATVLPPKGELEDTRLDEKALKQAAVDSQGGYYTLGNAAQLLDELPDGTRVELDQPCPPLPLWNHSLMFALVFSLPLAEWVLRKRARLL